MSQSFAEKFCATRKVHPAKFDEVVLRLTLRPMAGLLRPILNLDRDYFASDRELIRDVGRITRLEDFEVAAQDFSHNPYNRGLFHRVLRLRVSRRRLRALVRDTLKAPPAS
ncbi:MAG: hypothetical protein ACOYM3_30220 [Terrimicrobiaceae bacterium]